MAIDKKWRFRKLLNIIIFLGSVAVLFCVQQISVLAAFLLDNSKYDSYTSSGEFSLSYGILIQLAMLIFMLLSNNKNKCNLADNEALLNFGIRVYTSGSVLYLLQYLMTSFGGRISLYFMPIEILLFGQMLDGLELRGMRLKGGLLKIMLCGFLFAQAIYGIVTNGQGHVPYSCYTF